MPTKPKKAAPKATKPAAPKPNAVMVTYKAGGAHHSVPLRVPVAPGDGEAIINDAAKQGCTDLDAVRAQIRKHYA